MTAAVPDTTYRRFAAMSESDDLTRYLAANTAGQYWAESVEHSDAVAGWIAEILDDQGEAWDFLDAEDPVYAPAVRLFLLIHGLDRAADILRENQEHVQTFRQGSAEFWEAMFGEKPDHWMLGGFATGVFDFANAHEAV
jgi:hypothetical protein